MPLLFRERRNPIAQTREGPTTEGRAPRPVCAGKVAAKLEPNLQEDIPGDYFARCCCRRRLVYMRRARCTYYFSCPRRTTSTSFLSSPFGYSHPSQRQRRRRRRQQGGHWHKLPASQKLRRRLNEKRENFGHGITRSWKVVERGLVVPLYNLILHWGKSLVNGQSINLQSFYIKVHFLQPFSKMQQYE